MNPAWEDLDQFFNVDDFAVMVTFTDANGPRKPVPGVFDEPYFNKQLGEYEQDGGDPRLTLKESDTLGLKKNQLCNIAGTSVQYALLHDPRPDGQGTATVYLKRV